MQGIEAFTDLQLGKTPTQNTVFTNSAVKDVLMTFVEGNANRFENIPYYTLVSSLNGGLVREFKNLKININKSFCYLGGTTAVANTSLAFTFYYSDKEI